MKTKHGEPSATALAVAIATRAVIAAALPVVATAAFVAAILMSAGL